MKPLTHSESNETVIHHSADFDGIFCREIARKFLPDAKLIGWDFGDKPLDIPSEGTIYILDLPVDRVFGMTFDGKGYQPFLERVVWIDHHKSSIESHNPTIPGYRIDGVAACRLAWQWFTGFHCHDGSLTVLPQKQDFINRKVSEPLAVRLAGEYDIWDKRDSRADLFQHGLRSRELDAECWRRLLLPGKHLFDASLMDGIVGELLKSGESVHHAQTEQNKDIITSYGFDLDFEGMKFLACNHARFNSHLFTAGIKPEHDALLGFKFDGKNKCWSLSLYHAPGKEHHDLSTIATKYGGGGHRGACGFRLKTLQPLGL